VIDMIYIFVNHYKYLIFSHGFVFSRHFLIFFIYTTDYRHIIQKIEHF